MVKRGKETNLELSEILKEVSFRYLERLLYQAAQLRVALVQPTSRSDCEALLRDENRPAEEERTYCRS